MLELFNLKPSQLTLEDRILAMSDDTVHFTVPAALRQSRLFHDDEIELLVAWLVDFRASHHLDVIE